MLLFLLLRGLIKHFGCRLSYALKSGSKDTPHSNRKRFLFLFLLSFLHKASSILHTAEQSTLRVQYLCNYLSYTSQFSSHQPQVAMEHLNCGSSKLKCAISVRRAGFGRFSVKKEKEFIHNFNMTYIYCNLV